MATTTNFGWETPDDTDLVKDGAAAIRTALGGVDTSFVDLKGGTTGQLLSKASNTDLDFTFVTPSGAGKVLQVVTASYNTETVIATTSTTDTGLTATITPSSATSKIMVIISQPYMLSRDQTDTGLRYQIRRASTDIVDIQGGANLGLKVNVGVGGGGGFQVGFPLSYTILDSPATTSATTYKTTGSVYTTLNSGRVTFQMGSAAAAQMILMEIGA